MKLLAGYEIDFEHDLIIGKEGGDLGSFSAFKEFAKENHPEVVKKHLLKSILDKVTDTEIVQHDLINWVEVIHEIGFNND